MNKYVAVIITKTKKFNFFVVSKEMNIKLPIVWQKIDINTMDNICNIFLRKPCYPQGYFDKKNHVIHKIFYKKKLSE